MGWAYDDGGRIDAGFRGEAGDCVTRAVAIALELDYRQVYDELARRRGATGKSRSARQGIPRTIYEPFLSEHDWVWTPTMSIGSGCQTHLRADELPAGRLIARLSRHISAVIDGVVHDTHDPSRGGTRCVYGYYTKGL